MKFYMLSSYNDLKYWLIWPSLWFNTTCHNSGGSKTTYIHFIKEVK